jgi:AraC-like DNA-binding protein
VSRRAARWLWLDQVHDRVREGALSRNAGHVALVLAVHYANGRCEAWPSQLELAENTGRSRRTIQRALYELEGVGLLGVRHGPPAQRFGNVYRLQVRHSDALGGKRSSVTA